MSRRVTFFPKSEWDSDRRCVAFRAMVDGRNLRCLVREEALAELASGSAGTPMALFATHRDFIESTLRRILADNPLDEQEIVVGPAEVLRERAIPVEPVVTEPVMTDQVATEPVTSES